MNKRYMDFVPAQKKRVAKPTVALPGKPVEEKVVVKETVVVSGAKTFAIKKEPHYGIVEDYQPNFRAAKVEKRPLSRVQPLSPEAALVLAKSEKVKKRSLEAQPVRTEQPKEKAEVPKYPFINAEKVEKRPLSKSAKNVYKRQIAPVEDAPQEEAKPVTIIDKPKKDSRIRLVVTIILTIIFGAAVGTAAFLLLPK